MNFGKFPSEPDYDFISRQMQNSVSRMNAELAKASEEAANEQAERDDLARATAEATLETASAVKAINDAFRSDSENRVRLDEEAKLVATRRHRAVMWIAVLTLIAALAAAVPPLVRLIWP